MPQEVDDFTIVLSELINMATCNVKVYEGLDRLWRMFESYKMTAPMTIRVVDTQARCVRTIRGTRDQEAGWQLQDETGAETAHLGGEVNFPLFLNSQDARGNVLKMKLQFGVSRPKPMPDYSPD
jgi:hypothetical protein